MPIPNVRTPALSVGTRIEVRGKFDGSWSRGFEVAELVDRRYVVRRCSDGSIVPGPFVALDVRRAD